MKVCIPEKVPVFVFRLMMTVAVPTVVPLRVPVIARLKVSCMIRMLPTWLTVSLVTVVVKLPFDGMMVVA